MKHVLMVTFNFPPMVGGGVPRMAQFAKYLPNFGWRPTVLTVPFYPELAVDMNTLGALPDDVDILRAYCPLGRVGAPGMPVHLTGWAGLRRKILRKAVQLAFIPDRQILWYPYAVRAGKRAMVDRKFDVVLATYGPATDMLIGARLASLAGAPLVADFRDMWGDDPLWEWGTPLHKWLNQRMEARVVRQSSRVVGVAVGMCEQLRDRHGLSDEKLTCIPNGFDPDFLKLVRDSRADEGPDRPIRISFTGSVSGKSDFLPFFQTLAELAREGRVTPERLQIDFYGNMTLDQPREAGVEKFVGVHPSVPHAEVFKIFARSDVLMLIEPPKYYVKLSYACKLFDYMLAGKRILALVQDGEHTAPVVREGNLGWTADPNDRGAIRRVLEEILAGDRLEFRPVDIEREPWRRFNRKRLTERLATVLDEAAGLESPVVHERASYGGSGRG